MFQIVEKSQALNVDCVFNSEVVLPVAEHFVDDAKPMLLSQYDDGQVVGYEEYTSPTSAAFVDVEYVLVAE